MSSLLTFRLRLTDWGSVCVSWLPDPRSCCPRCKRLPWRTEPECVRLRQPHPGCGSLTGPGPAGAGCGSWLGLLVSQLGGLQQIFQLYIKENNRNDLIINCSFPVYCIKKFYIFTVYVIKGLNILWFPFNLILVNSSYKEHNTIYINHNIYHTPCSLQHHSTCAIWTN